MFLKKQHTVLNPLCGERLVINIVSYEIYELRHSPKHQASRSYPIQEITEHVALSTDEISTSNTVAACYFDLSKRCSKKQKPNSRCLWRVIIAKFASHPLLYPWHPRRLPKDSHMFRRRPSKSLWAYKWCSEPIPGWQFQSISQRILYDRWVEYQLVNDTSGGRGLLSWSWTAGLQCRVLEINLDRFWNRVFSGWDGLENRRWLVIISRATTCVNTVMIIE